VPGSILNIVEEINFDSSGRKRQVYGFAISAKRYALFTYVGGKIQLVKVSEHGLGLYYRPKEGRDKDCDCALWIREGWQWLVEKTLGIECKPPDWFCLPVMRRIAITTPNIMSALRRLNRDQARPYNFALSPVLVNLSGEKITLLGPFTKNSVHWRKMKYVNIHDGAVYTLNPPALLALPQTFEMVFSQYQRHPECKSLGPDGTPCGPDTRGLLRRRPVSALGVHLIGKETERCWEQDDDVSTLLPSLVQYQEERGVLKEQVRQRLLEISLTTLERKTGLSRHTLVRARTGKRVHARTSESLTRFLQTGRTICEANKLEGP